MSSTMSIVCSICTRHSPGPEHTGRTSTDILCHDASNSLCPSKRLEIPAFPLQGRSFRKGVKFSVQTTSPGSVPWRRCKLSEIGWSPVGSKDTIGRVVRVESTKFSDAQKRPDNDCVKVIHLANALQSRQMISIREPIPSTASTYLSLPAASIHAHNSTPVFPSLVPFQGREPQLSASHLPVVNRRCNSLVWACWRIWPSARGK